MSALDASRQSPHPALDAYYSSDEQKSRFLDSLFNQAASKYDRINAVAFWGAGGWYRTQALRRAGLQPGMRLLDVASGTGAVAQAACRFLDRSLIVCCDPSAQMLATAAGKLPGARFVNAPAERLPLESGSFDFLTFGYALRHVADLPRTFAEFHRLLARGGRLLMLEITKPRGRWKAGIARQYFRTIVPALSWLVTGDRQASMLMRYFWETIDACVPPETIIAHLQEAGFAQVNRRTELTVFSEYTAVKPVQPM